MATARERQLITLLLKERLERITGKKVILKERESFFDKFGKDLDLSFERPEVKTKVESGPILKVQIVKLMFDRGLVGPKKTTYTGTEAKIVKQLLKMFSEDFEETDTLKGLIDELNTYEDGNWYSDSFFITEIKIISPEEKLLYKCNYEKFENGENFVEFSI